MLGSTDLVVASSALCVVLHAFVDISFLPFLGAYLLAMVAGVVSNVPGGVGVFESAMLLLLPDLQRVSDEWIPAKGAQEKGFSLGFFNREYLSNFDCTVVRVEGEIAAFANLWASGGFRELAADLMRFSAAAPGGSMDALFTQTMLWGREQGYEWFSLGMAPLAGLESPALAPAWNKLGNVIFRSGEHIYNFEGLRHYKQKFEPEWAPRYLVSKGGIQLPAVLLDTTALVSGGVEGLLGR